jgi:hypothetical protein
MEEWSVPLTISATAEDPLAASGSQWCAVRADGQVACWLENDPRADQVVAGPAVAVTVGCGFACAVRPDRTVTCWRQDAYGLFSDDGELDVPADLGPVRSVSAGCSRVCAVRADGTVSCWGRTAPPPADLGPCATVATDDDAACAILKGDSTLACWNNVPAAPHGTPPIPGQVSSVSTAGQHWCALRSDGGAACWGESLWGQVAVPAGLGRLVAIRAGWNVTCALDDQGGLSCLGFWSHTARAPGASRLVIGLTSVCTVLPDWTLRCWRYNSY